MPLFVERTVRLITLIPLDLSTLMAMESFVAVLAGLALIYGWWQDRAATPLLLWGVSNVLVSGGIYCFWMAGSSGNPVWAVFGTALVALSSGLVWAAMRVFAHQRAPVAIVAAGVALVVVSGLLSGAGAIPEAFAAGAPLLAGCVYSIASALILWRGRAERLAARVPLMVLLLMHAVMLGTGAAGSLAGEVASDLIAPLGSAFGAIHFESIVFYLGTAVFLFALMRERNELLSRRAADTDGLTGIANRQSFMERADRMLARAKRSKEPVAVVMFDLDHFKAINDGHGHSTGDQVIRHFVRVVRDAMRPTDLFGRIGGEEFALVLPVTDADIAFARADRIRIDFGRSSFATVNEEVLTATVSAGVTAGSGPTIAALLAEADNALYRAKAAGRNRVMKAAAAKSKPVLRVA